jgi:hypothetical protein
MCPLPVTQILDIPQKNQKCLRLHRDDGDNDDDDDDDNNNNNNN